MTTQQPRVERRQRTAEDLYGQQLITPYEGFPFYGTTFIPVPNVYVVRDALRGSYFVAPWGMRIHTPFRNTGYVFNLGLVQDRSSVGEIIFRSEEGVQTTERIPGVVELNIFYGLAMADARRNQVYANDRGVLRQPVTENAEQTLTDRIIDTIVQFRETTEGYNEAVDGLRTEIRNIVRRSANNLTLPQATRRLRSNLQRAIPRLNQQLEQRWNLYVLRIAVEPKYTSEVLRNLEQVQAANMLAQADARLINSLKSAGLEGQPLADAYKASRQAFAQVESSQNLAGGRAPIIVQAGGGS